MASSQHILTNADILIARAEQLASAPANIAARMLLEYSNDLGYEEFYELVERIIEETGSLEETLHQLSQPDVGFVTSIVDIFLSPQRRGGPRQSSKNVESRSSKQFEKRGGTLAYSRQPR